ncbi:MAG TPA: hypothetical protein VH092_08890 [Urbifossiella sp.]|nr:hypothetical protein [Urbifossiella sp.]
MEIRPGWGVGPLPFGVTEATVVAALGPPDKRYTTDSGVRRFQFFGPRLELAFEPENGDRFGWAEVHDPGAVLRGRRVVGEPAADVVEWIAATLGERPEHSEVGGSESYFFPRGWVDLWVGFGRVVSVNLGVMYGEDDEPVWPSEGLTKCDSRRARVRNRASS